MASMTSESAAQEAMMMSDTTHCGMPRPLPSPYTATAFIQPPLLLNSHEMLANEQKAQQTKTQEPSGMFM